MLRARRASPLIATSVYLLSASTAFAHIDLLEPEARAHGTAARGDTDIDVNSNLKSGPCGQVAPGRTERVATYAPGQRITVRVREENAHASYLRVSLDLDGEDFPLRSQIPAGPETQEVAAAAEAALGGDGLLAVYREDNDTPGFIHEIDVTLPDVRCDDCTLQVLQFMYDDPAAPYYFQCADLVIAAAGGSEDAGRPDDNVGSVGTNSGTSAAPNLGAAASAESANGASAAPQASPPGAAGATAASDGASGPADTTTAAPASAAVASDGSDGCNMSRRDAGLVQSASLGLLALGLGLVRRRR